MKHTVIRVNAVNTHSIVSLAALFALIFGTVIMWRVGTPRLVACAVAALVMVLIAVHMLAAKVLLDETRVSVGGGLYRVEVPWHEVIGPSQTPELVTLRWRKNGIRLPGFALGWFATNDGRKVFAARGRAKDGFRIRLRGPFDLVVGVDARDALLRELEERISLFSRD